MIRLKFRCPGCNKEYSVKADSKDALLAETFACPSCHKNTPFRSILSPAPAQPAMHTHIATGAVIPSSDTGEKTRIATVPAMGAAGAKSPIVLVVEGTGRRLSVPFGVHVLGRDSSDSRASLRIATDPYMSRSHAELAIVREGKGLRCSIRSLRSANTVIINNVALPEGKSHDIKPGEKILLGMTVFHLELNK